MSDAEAEKDLVQLRPWPWPPIVDDPTHAPPAPVTRSEFDALKREVDAMKQPRGVDRSAVEALIADFRRRAERWSLAAADPGSPSWYERHAKDETWKAAANDLQFLLKTTE